MGKRNGKDIESKSQPRVFSAGLLTASEAKLMPKKDRALGESYLLQDSSIQPHVVSDVFTNGVVLDDGCRVDEPKAVRLAFHIDADGSEVGKSIQIGVLDCKFYGNDENGYGLAVADDVLKDAVGNAIVMPFRECHMENDEWISDKTGKKIKDEDLNNYEESDVRNWIENNLDSYGISISLDSHQSNKVAKKEAISCGGDDKNMYYFYSGGGYEHNNLDSIAKFGKEHFESMKDMSIDEIKSGHIYWATESTSYNAFYNGDTYVLFDDIEKLPDRQKKDAYANCRKYRESSKQRESAVDSAFAGIDSGNSVSSEKGTVSL